MKHAFLLIFLSTYTWAAQKELVQSRYSNALSKINFSSIQYRVTSDEFSVQCLSTPEKPFLVGIAHQIKIKAPLQKVVEVFEDFQKYPEIFLGLKRTLITGKPSSEKIEVEYEGEIPIPFVPNSIYTVLYTTRLSSLKEKAYLFQVYKTESLNSLDGIVLIRSLTPVETLYYELDFLDAQWGIVEKLSPKSIWKEPIIAAIQSDFAVKLRSEDFSKPLKQVKKESAWESTDRKRERQVTECLTKKTIAQEYISGLAK